jgi:hypothetical protein
MKFVFFSFLALLPLTLPAQDGPVEANKKLRATVQKWTAVMKEIQETKRSWRDDRQIYLDSKEALKAEKAQLDGEIEAAEKRKATLDSKSSDKLKQKETYDNARKALRAGLDGLEDRISAVLPLLPKELLANDKLDKAISDHKSFVSKKGKEKEAIALNSRLGAMVTILVEAEKFNQIVTNFDNRSARVKGQDVILDGLYFGLAMGFAANGAGTTALQLTPGPEGWQETEITDAEVIQQVRELIDIGKGAGEVRLVPMPLEIAK